MGGLGPHMFEAGLVTHNSSRAWAGPGLMLKNPGQAWTCLSRARPMNSPYRGGLAFVDSGGLKILNCPRAGVTYVKISLPYHLKSIVVFVSLLCFAFEISKVQ